MKKPKNARGRYANATIEEKLKAGGGAQRAANVGSDGQSSAGGEECLLNRRERGEGREQKNAWIEIWE